MEILPQSFKKIVLSVLNDFQIKVWGILVILFERLLFEKISRESLIDEGAFLDVILKSKKNDFVLAFSVRKDVLHINSNYFDIYVYPETSIHEIQFLIENILSGNYFICLGYSKKGKLVRQELIFRDKRLEKFNEKNKIGFFTRKVINEKRVDGVKLISDS